jgi:hypothetical protein
MLILLGLLVFIYSVVCAIGFIVLPSFGEIYASFALSGLIFFTFIFGDRVLLGFMRAKLNAKQDDLNYELSNVSLKFSIPRVNLYLSNRVSGWHILDNSFTSPSIIINPLTLKHLNRDELSTLFSLCCYKMNLGLARRTSIFLVVFTVVLYPLALCPLLERYKLVYLSMLIKFLLFPFIILKDYILDAGEKESELVHSFLEKYPYSESIHGAIFKIKSIPAKKGNDLLDFCVETISLTDQESKEKLSYYLRATR